MNSNRSKFLAWAITIFLGLLWTHWNHISADATITYDDTIVVIPLQQIQSLSEYFDKFSAGQIWERQPVKDFTHMADYWLQKHFPFWSMHFTNVLIWYLTVLFTFFICRLWMDWLPATCMVSILAFHPLALNCIGWLSARKHLLAAMFVTASTLLFLKAIKNKNLRLFEAILLVILFCLAGLSHMIVVLYPAWMFLHLLNQKDAQKSPFFICIGIMTLVSVAVFWWNLDYYTNVFPQLSDQGGQKFRDTSDDVGFRVLAIGGYFSRIFLPLWPSTTPIYPGSSRNIVGIVGLVFFFFFIRKFIRRDLLLSFSLYMAFPLLPVTAKITNVFASGTYLLNSLVGVTILIGIAFKDYFFRFRKQMIGASVVLSVSFLLLTKSFSVVWTDDFEFWSASARAEPTRQNLTVFGNLLLEKGQYKEAYEMGVRAHGIEPDSHYVSQLMSKATYLNPALADEEKISILSGFQAKSSWWYYYMSFLFFNKKDYKNAFEYSQRGLSEPNRLLKETKADLEVVIAEFTRFCELAKGERCERIKIKYQDLKPNWNEMLFLSTKEKFDHATKFKHNEN